MTVTGRLARAGARTRSGITLTEILIAIMILGVGLVSLATLFPIGLLRLRDATRYSRTKYLVESASGDGTARGLFGADSFSYADNLNYYFQAWVSLRARGTPRTVPRLSLILRSHRTRRAISRTGSSSPAHPGAHDSRCELGQLGGLRPPLCLRPALAYHSGQLPGRLLHGRPVRGPLWLGDRIHPHRPLTDTLLPSAHGLQRITNFNRPFLAITVAGVTTYQPIMPAATAVPSIFVSPEDVVWVENLASNPFSPVLPDLGVSNPNATPGAPVRRSRKDVCRRRRRTTGGTRGCSPATR